MTPFCYNAKVSKIIDGDTIKVDIDLGFDIWMRDQSIRLFGIDTPESRTTDNNQKKLGLLAKKQLSSHCPEGSDILLQTFVDKAKFGQFLGIISTTKGINVNQWLIDNNYAVEYFGQSKASIQEAHQKNEAILKERGEL